MVQLLEKKYVLREGIIWLFFFFMLLSYFSFSQMNLFGKFGLMYIFDGSEINDGIFRLGYVYNFINYGLRRNLKNFERVLFGNLMVVCCLDISFFFLQMILIDKYKVKEGFGDRQFDVRYFFFKEKSGWFFIVIVFFIFFIIDVVMLI